MKRFKMMAIATMLTAGIGGSLVMPLAAHASEAGQRNTTLALGALTALLAAKGDYAPAAVTGIGTVIAEQSWQHSIDARHRWDNRDDRQDNRGDRWDSRDHR